MSLLGDWPTVSYGGARFLSQGREHFLSQYTNLLEYDPVPGFDSMFLDPLTPYMLSIARYGYKRAELMGLNMSSPIHGRRQECSKECSDLNLVLHPSLRRRALVMSRPQSVMVGDLSQEVQFTGRQARPLVEQWGRLHVELIPVLFDRMNAKPDIYNRFCGFYECLRVTYMNLGQNQPVELEKCKTKLRRSITKDHRESTSKLAIINSALDLLHGYKTKVRTAVDWIEEGNSRTKKVNRIHYKNHLREVPSMVSTAELVQEFRAEYQDDYRQPDNQDVDLVPDKDLMNAFKEAQKDEGQVDPPESLRIAKRVRDAPVNRISDPVYCPPPKRKKTSHRAAPLVRTVSTTPAQDSLRIRVVDQEQKEVSSTQVKDKGQRSSTPVQDEPQDESMMSVEAGQSPTTQYQEVIDQPPVSLLDLPDEEEPANMSVEELVIVEEEQEVVENDKVTEGDAQ